MSLDKATLQSSIKSAFTSLQGNQNNNAEDTANTLATKLADAIDVFIKSGLVKVTADSGLIQVEGSATKQANTSPIVIEGAVE